MKPTITTEERALFLDVLDDDASPNIRRIGRSIIAALDAAEAEASELRLLLLAEQAVASQPDRPPADWPERMATSSVAVDVIEGLRADLARVTAERDAARRLLLEGVDIVQDYAPGFHVWIDTARREAGLP